MLSDKEVEISLMRNSHKERSPLSSLKSMRNKPVLRISSGASSFIDAIAVLTIWLDNQISNLGKLIFSIIPSKLRRILIDLNRTYLRHRNRILKIDMESSTPYRSAEERGDVPGWVLVVLMTTGLVTALWTIAAPRLSQILKNSLDSMNNIR
ncbi:MAG: hypothetical protein RLY74_587 [Actinomycetota bacterium]|jgi:hypothetical protein